MIDLNAIKQHRARWTPDDSTSLPTICEHVDALVAEVERLRAEVERERAAVVAWLRRKATDDFCALRVRVIVDDPIDEAADAIEQGEHRREEQE